MSPRQRAVNYRGRWCRELNAVCVIGPTARRVDRFCLVTCSRGLVIVIPDSANARVLLVSTVTYISEARHSAPRQPYGYHVDRRFSPGAYTK